MISPQHFGSATLPAPDHSYFSALDHPLDEHLYAKAALDLDGSFGDRFFPPLSPEVALPPPVDWKAKGSLEDTFARLTGKNLPDVMAKRGTADDVVTLVDATGREFETNLRRADISYLVQHSLLQKMKLSGRYTNSASIASSLSSSTAAAVAAAAPGRPPFDYPPNKLTGSSTRDFCRPRPRPPSSVEASEMKIAQLAGIGPPLAIPLHTTINNVKRHKHPKVSFMKPSKVLSGSLSPKKLKVPSSDRPPAAQHDKQPKMEKSTGGRRSTGQRRCRGVYGVDKHESWCNMCKWKKRCSRFRNSDDEDLPTESS